MFCTNCGKPLIQGAAFCGECGARIVRAIANHPANIPVSPPRAKQFGGKKKSKVPILATVCILTVAALGAGMLVALDLFAPSSPLDGVNTAVTESDVQPAAQEQAQARPTAQIDQPAAAEEIREAQPPPPPSPLAHLGASVTLAEAQGTPGLFIKYGDRFIPIRPQWTNEPGGFAGRQIRGQGVTGHFGSSSNMKAVLFNSGFQIPRIPNNAQLVLIGEENIGIYATFHNGWTIPHGVNLGLGRNAFGVASGSERVALLNYTQTTSGASDAWFDTLNGQEPLNFQDRMVYTRVRFGLMPFHGILTGTPHEQFTFGRWEGTNWVETTYSADRRFFTMTSGDTGSDRGIRADYEIVRTMNGYFEVNFLTAPLGYYAIGHRMHWLNRVVEFAPPDAS